MEGVTCSGYLIIDSIRKRRLEGRLFYTLKLTDYAIKPVFLRVKMPKPIKALPNNHPVMGRGTCETVMVLPETLKFRVSELKVI